LNFESLLDVAGRHLEVGADELLLEDGEPSNFTSPILYCSPSLTGISRRMSLIGFFLKKPDLPSV